MADGAPIPEVAPVDAGDPQVLALLGALTAELALSGYTAEQTFGYSSQQLDRAGVHLVCARVAGQLVGIGGVELQDGGVGELKRFFVVPEHRGSGVADAVLSGLLDYSIARDRNVLRLETGDRQRAAMAFYRRHGFTDIARFGPYVDSETSICMERRLP